MRTDRLNCEPISSGHADSMYPLLSDETLYEFLDSNPPESVEALRARYRLLEVGESPDGKESWLNWILVLRATGLPVGFYQATVHAESCSIAYVLGREHWGQGYAVEAGHVVLGHLFDQLGVSVVRAEVHPSNRSSKKLLKRLGFAYSRHDASEGDDIYELGPGGRASFETGA